MTDPLIQTYLMACMLVAMSIILLWGLFRKNIKLRAVATPSQIGNYKLLKRVSRGYWAIFAVFLAMVVIYAALPQLYFLFIPLDQFHHPVINSIGMLVTKMSIVWLIVAQLHIDKELFKHFRDIESLSAMELICYSEGMLVSGMLILFLGIVITITNIIGLILVGFGVVTFLKSRIYKRF